MDLAKFTLRYALDVGWQPSRKSPVEKLLCVRVEKAPDHLSNLPMIRTARNAYIRVAGCSVNGRFPEIYSNHLSAGKVADFLEEILRGICREKHLLISLF